MSRNTIAWKNGQWLPLNEVHLGLDDWGVLQGAMIVDRLRTIDTDPLDLPLHLDRLKSNCLAIGIDSIEIGQLGDVILECAQHNQSRLIDKDFSIVVLVTPGLRSTVNSPTVIVHVQPLNWIAIHYWHAHGQPLVLASNRNVPRECWSPQLKTRARMQYYLADRECHTRDGVHAGAILLNTDGFVTETSAANVIVVDQAGIIFCPPAESILGGVSLVRTLRLAEVSGLQVVREPISVAMIESASEVILTGTSACIWPASQFESVVFSDPTERPVYRELLRRWIDDIGFDYRPRSRTSKD